ncbi:MAG: lipid-A-disaccharide synthase [Bacteroidales bacterium]|nr:lipid-A-disaccharide synthase [Bacteroidales bacterium]
MKYYIISGEASGDLHAANLVKHIFLRDTRAQVRAWGGNLLRQAGACVVKDYSETAYMGFVEVLTHLRSIVRNFAFCKKDILTYQPDVVILVDYPGFNLRIARYLHKHKIPVYYYISPQVWAWKKNRVHTIRQNVDEMFVILPFEQEFYAQYGVKVHYFGHPLLDVVQQFKADADFAGKYVAGERPVVAVLPGSRHQEIKRMLPVMLAVAGKYKDYQFIIAGVEQHKKLYGQYVHGDNIKIMYNNTYNLLSHACAAMVTSGTATLETALFNVPQVVCYKATYLSYYIAKHLVKGIKYISLVNLIADDDLVKELIQSDMNVNSLQQELDKILQGAARNNMLQKYDRLHQKLGDGKATEKIVANMIELLHRKNARESTE